MVQAVQRLGTKLGKHSPFPTSRCPEKTPQAPAIAGGWGGDRAGRALGAGWKYQPGRMTSEIPSADCCTDVLKASPALPSAAGWSNAANTCLRGCWVGGMLGHPILVLGHHSPAGKSPLRRRRRRAGEDGLLRTLYVSHSLAFPFRVQPKFQRCFPLISGSHWSRSSLAESSMSLCSAPLLWLGSFPQPPACPQNPSPTSGPKAQQGGECQDGDARFRDAMLAVF